MTRDVEFELVKHGAKTYNIFIVNMLCRSPHVHRDFEVCLLLDGETVLSLPQNKAQERELTLQKGAVWIINPFQIHALHCTSPARILALQLSPDFFSQFWQEASNVRFTDNVLKDDSQKARNVLIKTARAFFDDDASDSAPPCAAAASASASDQRRDALEERLYCAENITHIFRMLLLKLPHRMVTEKELAADRTRARRAARITQYIDANCSRKLLLQELSEKENVSLPHLSHFFTRTFGMPFQEYLSRVRCENARLMMASNPAINLLDVSMACGFSDSKYFNRDFKAFYAMSPAEYRHSRQEISEKKTVAAISGKASVHQAGLIKHPNNSNASAQEFLTREQSLTLLLP